MSKHSDDWSGRDWMAFLGVTFTVGVAAAVLTSTLFELALFILAIALVAVFAAGPDAVVERWSGTVKSPWWVIAVGSVVVIASVTL